MLQIECPWCGLRDEIEFRCGGPSHVQRPGPPDTIGETVWADYLFFNENPKGELRERWVHAAGCRQWFNVVRSTVSHEIVAVYRMGEAGPSVNNITGRADG
jgi:sarcosine oxidase, subunit delta